MRRNVQSFSNDSLSQLHGEQDGQSTRLKQGTSINDMRHDSSWDVVAAEEQSLSASAPSQSSTASASIKAQERIIVSSKTVATDRCRSTSSSGDSRRHLNPNASSFSCPSVNALPFITIRRDEGTSQGSLEASSANETSAVNSKELPAQMQEDASSVWSLDIEPQSIQGFSSDTDLMAGNKRSAFVHYEPIVDDDRVESGWTLNESSMPHTETTPSSGISQCQEAISNWSLDAPIKPIADFFNDAAYQALPTESPAQGSMLHSSQPHHPFSIKNAAKGVVAADSRSEADDNGWTLDDERTERPSNAPPQTTKDQGRSPGGAHRRRSLHGSQSTHLIAASKLSEDAVDDLREASWKILPPTLQYATPPSTRSPSLSGISALLPSTPADESEPLLQQNSILCLCEIKG